MEKWIVDKAHSIIGFEVSHMMVSKVRGQFDSFTAEINATDIMDLTTAKIGFKLLGNSINTRNQTRDKHLKSADFFEIKKYPTIDFISTQITKLENNNGYEVTGDLTIKDITKPVTFNVNFSGSAKDLDGVVVYGFEAETMINREEFGLTWNAILETGGVFVGNDIRIFVSLELKPANLVASNTTNVNKQIEINNNDLNKELRNSDLHEMIAENLTDLVLIINNQGVIQYATPSFNTVLNYDTHYLLKSNFFNLIHPEEQNDIRNEVITFSRRTIKTKFTMDFRILDSNGNFIEVEASFNDVKNKSISNHEDGLILIVMRDISERKEVENAIYHLAFHDSLTNLPNRRSFMSQLQSEIMDRKYSKTKLSVFFIDLDNFKSINDTWGHDAGDYVIKEAAKRIQAAICPKDIVARFGGDEFIVMLKDIKDEQNAIKIAENILNKFQNPITGLGHDYSISVSIGIAQYPSHGDSAEELLKNADTALYYVKERNKNDYMVFNDIMEHQSLERRLLESALRQGIKEQQFYLEYQPKMNMAKNKLIGTEALVRWNHPELGVIPPMKFIPLAEDTGLIVPLGEWILKESIKQLMIWHNKGFPSLNLSINVSVRQLEDPNFVDKVKTILKESRINPSLIEFEITESVLANIKSAEAILREIRNLGISISIDDFGTGYSSLSYIKELPIDTLKIDRSFIKDIHINNESKEIARAIINLANSIGLSVVAEGVELKEHVEELSKEECMLGQGYFYSRPLKVEDFEQYMTDIQKVS